MFPKCIFKNNHSPRSIRNGVDMPKWKKMKKISKRQCQFFYSKMKNYMKQI